MNSDPIPQPVIPPDPLVVECLRNQVFMLTRKQAELRELMARALPYVRVAHHALVQEDETFLAERATTLANELEAEIF